MTTDTDRKLLEAAARAVNRSSWHPLTHDTPGGRPWNPLHDIADATRLLLALKLRVDYVGDQPCIDGVLQHGMTAEESFCRAVTRAAAAMAPEKEQA